MEYYVWFLEGITKLYVRSQSTDEDHRGQHDSGQRTIGPQEICIPLEPLVGSHVCWETGFQVERFAIQVVSGRGGLPAFSEIVLSVASAEGTMGSPFNTRVGHGSNTGEEAPFGRLRETEVCRTHEPSGGGTSRIPAVRVRCAETVSGSHRPVLTRVACIQGGSACRSATDAYQRGEASGGPDVLWCRRHRAVARRGKGWRPAAAA